MINLKEVAYCSWDGRPAVWKNGNAVAFLKGKWTRVDDWDVFHTAKVLTKQQFEDIFPCLPALPAAF